MKKLKSNAHVVDGKLILSLPGAMTPVLWQMDLNDAKASALEIKKTNDDEQHALTLKTPRGEAVSIADFDNRNDALSALMMISKALEKAGGQIRNHGKGGTDSHSTPDKSGRLGGIITGVVGVIFLIVLITLWMAMAGGPGATSGGISNTASTSSKAESAVGVPVSADDFLRGQ